VREETGLVVRVGGVLGMWIDAYAPAGPDADKVTLNIYFHATPEGLAEVQTDPNEVAEIRWFSADELPHETAFPGHLPAVLEARRETLAPPASRAPARRPSASRTPEPTV
jgi:8-oxo-dGTP pyrophosphatase MutT (NUDIX family)